MYQLKHMPCLLLAALSYVATTSAEYNARLEPGMMAITNPKVGHEYAVNDTIEVSWEWVGSGNWTFGLIAGSDDTDLTGTNITVKSTDYTHQYNYTIPAQGNVDSDHSTPMYLGVVWAYPNGTWNRNLTSRVIVNRNESTKNCTHLYRYERANRSIIVSEDGECGTKDNAAGKTVAANGVFGVVAAVAFSVFFFWISWIDGFLDC